MADTITSQRATCLVKRVLHPLDGIVLSLASSSLLLASNRRDSFTWTVGMLDTTA